MTFLAYITVNPSFNLNILLVIRSTEWRLSDPESENSFDGYHLGDSLDHQRVTSIRQTPHFF